MTAAGTGALPRRLPAGDPNVFVAFEAALAQLGPFETSPRIAVAVSGGPDSLALAFLAAEWCQQRNGQVIALTVDHKLRTESAQEAAQVATWMAEYGITHHILEWEGPKPDTGIQEAARQARYRLLTTWCGTQGILHLLLGHHADDQAETYIFRTHRHSGPDGLAGMAAIVDLPQLRLLRPLLGLRRESLLQDLHQRKHDFLIDPSNANLGFTRVRLRTSLTEADRRTALARACEAGERRALAESQTALLLAAHATVDRHGFITLDLTDLAPADDACLLQILRRLALCVGNQDYPPRTERLQSLMWWLRQGLKNPAASRPRTLGGCYWRIGQKNFQLFVCREPRACAPSLLLDPKHLTFPASRDVPPQTVWWDGRFLLKTSLFCSDRSEPLFIDAFGRLPKNLPESLTADLPARVRATLPVIKDSSGILAIPHFGYLRPKTAIYRRLGSDAARIIKETVQFRPRHPLSPTSFCLLRAN